MGHMSDERYDAKEAYNKNLSSKSRMRYLENDIADRKGHSGSYSGESSKIFTRNKYDGRSKRYGTSTS